MIKLFKKKSVKSETQEDKPLGDGKAVFISFGDEEDYQDFQREEKGLKKWYNRILNL